MNDQHIKIKEKYSAEISQIEKMVLNMATVSSIRYWYQRLSNFKATEDAFNDIREMDALTTSIIIAYGRLFGKGDGSSKIRVKDIPEPLRSTHKEIIDFRHARYAHHGKHNSTKIRLEVNFNESESCFVITPNLYMGMYLGAPTHWGALFEWIDLHNYYALQNKLNQLKKATGVTWTITQGPAPDYA